MPLSAALRTLPVRVALVAAFTLLVLLGFFLLRPRQASVKAFGIKMPLQYALHGIDVSRYQGSIDWAAAAAMQRKGVRLRFVFIKATEGVSIIDPMFETNWSSARRVRLARGAYHFYRTKVFSGDQAAAFIRAVPLVSGDLPPVLDIEELDGVPPETMRRGIKNWLKIVEKHYGVAPIIYTNKDFWRNYLNTPDLRDYRLWIAHYGVADLHLAEPWLFWQHSERGMVEGIDERTDFNAFCCDSMAFKSLLIE